MKPIGMIAGRVLIGFTLVSWGLATGLPGSAMAAASCAVSEAAGKAQAPRTASGDEGKFRIYWHIATQIEDLADAANSAGNMMDLKAARSLVDGYYLNVLLGGPLIYWPDRPVECGLNFKRIGERDTIEVDGDNYSFDQGGKAGRQKCVDQQNAFVRSKSNAKNPARDVQEKALGRAFENLDLSGEQKRGKGVWGATLIRSTEFTYDKSSDSVKMDDLPETYCILNRNGIIPNQLFVYQEPRIQTKKKNFLWIPRKNRRGKVRFSENQLRDKMPENTRAFDLVEDAFRDARVPLGGMRANIRRWKAKRTPGMVEELANLPEISGFNFEGGSRIMTNEAKYINNFVEGMSWILANTDRDISLLMPGYWTRDKVGNKGEIDELIGRVRATVLALNSKLNAKMKLPKGKNAICSNRFVFIPASYGQPVHVRTFPMSRNGHLAGTVTGQIKLLSEIRNDLCGS